MKGILSFSKYPCYQVPSLLTTLQWFFRPCSRISTWSLPTAPGCLGTFPSPRPPAPSLRWPLEIPASFVAYLRAGLRNPERVAGKDDWVGINESIVESWADGGNFRAVASSDLLQCVCVAFSPSVVGQQGFQDSEAQSVGKCTGTESLNRIFKNSRGWTL